MFISVVVQNGDGRVWVSNMSVAPAYTRTVVHVRKDRREPFQPAEFGLCLLDYFDIYDDFGRVECYINDNIVYLQPPPSPPQGRHTHTSGGQDDQHMAFRFQHPPFCVAHKIKADEKAALPPEILGRGVDVGVCIILETADDRLLMTRRAPHMRTFPGVWVPPGGHVEEGETLETAGLREVLEETGLLVSPEEGEAGCRMLGLWESLYPPVLYMGKPKRHHLVVYLHLQVSLTSYELQQRLKLDSSEVDACLWLTKEMAELVVFGSSRRASQDIPITLINREGEQSMGILNPKTLTKKMPEPGFEVERLTTGTRYALKLWLQQHYMGGRQSGRQLLGQTRINQVKMGRHESPLYTQGQHRLYTSEPATTHPTNTHH
ncbi:nucleoside diphosphate-linked moiety X motif 17-like isoform X2 [Homarus americanus]|nr:nucleoside diphosphate-linked moiety X motif 17-like isoform X2 [Homarus americanus]